jgi:hypothetical protein
MTDSLYDNRKIYLKNLKVLEELEATDSEIPEVRVNTALAAGLMIGGSFPSCAATITFLFRKAYPGESFTTLLDE